MHYALYAPETSRAYLWGAYHVHSLMSDGLSNPAEIAIQAAAAGDSFIILTDHGSPNFQSLAYNHVLNGVTFVGGAETTLPEGHLTYFGASTVPDFSLPPYPPAAMDDVREWGAFPILAYPSDPRQGWRYWGRDLKPSGIEVMSLFTSLLVTSKPERARLLLFCPFSRYFFLKDMRYPAEAFDRWDEFLRKGKTWGFLATDAHGGFHIGHTHSLSIPSYKTSFLLATIGISRNYASAPETALRTGDFFNCIRGAGEPQKFEFYATQGQELFGTGSEPPAGADLHVRVRTLHMQVRLVLKKDGAVFREGAGGDLDLTNAPGGVYRVEAYLPHHPMLPPDVPWIFSNPIFVGGVPAQAPPRPAHGPLRVRAVNLSDLQAASDAGSKASLAEISGKEKFSCALDGYTLGKLNRWCSAGYDKPVDLSGTAGFYLDAVSNTYERYTVEIADGDIHHYGSCKFYPGAESACRIPYREFYGEAGDAPLLRPTFVNSIALRVKNSGSPTGFQATLQISQMGFYSETPIRTAKVVAKIAPPQPCSKTGGRAAAASHCNGIVLATLRTRR